MSPCPSFQPLQLASDPTLGPLELDFSSSLGLPASTIFAAYGPDAALDARHAGTTARILTRGFYAVFIVNACLAAGVSVFMICQKELTRADEGLLRAEASEKDTAEMFAKRGEAKDVKVDVLADWNASFSRWSRC